jgi:hypothetical protein
VTRKTTSTRRIQHRENALLFRFAFLYIASRVQNHFQQEGSMKKLFILAFAVMLLLGLGVGLVLATSSSVGDTWKDPQSGLTWQVAPTGGMMQWEAAKSHCASLNLGGSSGWRLPTISELRTLIRGCAATQTGGSCGVTDSCLNSSCGNRSCDGCNQGAGPDNGNYWPSQLAGDVKWYWSSSAVADNGNFVWRVYFWRGWVSEYGGVNGGLARCVR